MRRIGRTGSVVLGVLVVVAGSVAVDVGHPTSHRDRGSDLRALVTQVKADLASCNASVGDSFEAYTEVVAGRPDERGAAEKIIRDDEPYCTPVANSDLYDLATLEVPASLRAFSLQPVLTQLDTWAFPDGAAAIGDVGSLLADPGDVTARHDLDARLADMAGLDRSAEGRLAIVATSLSTRVTTLDLRPADRLGTH